MTLHLSMVRDILGLYTVNRNVTSITKFVVVMSFFPELIILWHIPQAVKNTFARAQNGMFK